MCSSIDRGISVQLVSLVSTRKLHWGWGRGCQQMSPFTSKLIRIAFTVILSTSVIAFAPNPSFGADVPNQNS